MEANSPLEAKLLRINLPLENFHFHKLSEQEKKAVHDPNDYPILSTVYGLSEKDLDLIYHTILVKSTDKTLFHEYLFNQEKWLEDFRYYFCLNKNKDVSCTDEFCDSVSKGPIKTYRLYFAAKHPDRVTFCEQVKEGCEKTKAFLLLASIAKEVAEREGNKFFVD